MFKRACSNCQGTRRYWDPLAIEPLVTALKDKDRLVREAATEALVKINGARAVDSLIAVLEDKKWGRGTIAVAGALGEIGDPRAVESLIDAMEDRDGALNQAAAEALGMIGDPCAVESLIKALTNESLELQCAAARALGEIGDSRGVAPLISIVVNPGYYPGSGDRSSAAASALCKIYRKGKIDFKEAYLCSARQNKISCPRGHVPRVDGAIDILVDMFPPTDSREYVSTNGHPLVTFILSFKPCEVRCLLTRK